MGMASKERANGVWRDLDYAIREANRVMDQYGDEKLPSQGELNKRHEGGLAGAIHNYHGGFRRFRELLGESQVIGEQGIWRDQEYALGQAREIMRSESWNRLPSGTILTKEGYSGLINAIQSYHGGMRAFRIKLGDQSKRREDGVWRDQEYVVEEARKALKKKGWDRLPSAGVLHQSGYSGLANAIPRYHGGMRAFRKLLGDESIQREPGYYEKWKNVEEELREAIEENGGEFPTQKQFQAQRRSSLVAGITSHHGGLSGAQKRLGFEAKRKSRGYWDDLENVEREIREIIEKTGEFPTQKALKDSRRTDLSAAISKHGGFDEVRKHFGYEPLQKPDGYWKEWGNMSSELVSIVGGLGYFPSGGELNRLGHGSLVVSIGKYHGGIFAVRERLEGEGKIKTSGQELEDIVGGYGNED
jgi:hypothetical protein